MEGLLQALASEKKAGQFFRKYVQKSGNEVKNSVKNKLLGCSFFQHENIVTEALPMKLIGWKKAVAIYNFWIHIISLFAFQLWKNGLSFWEELQRYHNMFYSEILDVYLLEKISKVVFFVIISHDYLSVETWQQKPLAIIFFVVVYLLSVYRGWCSQINSVH